MATRSDVPPRIRARLTTLAARAPTLRQGRRAQGLLWLAEGATVMEVARRLHVSRQSVYVWQERLGWAGDLAARLADRPRSGRPRTTGHAVDEVIAEVIGTDPREHGYRLASWTTGLLRQQLRHRRDLTVSARTIRRCLRRLGYRYKRPRYVLARRAPHWRQAKGGSSGA
jgi:putative transposase